MKKIAAGAALSLMAGLGLVAVSPANEAHAVQMNVSNRNCKNAGRKVYTIDGTGKRYGIDPGAQVNMKNGGRKVWIPARSYVFKGGCGSAWALNTSYSGYWKSFSWRVATDFSYLNY